MLRSLRWRLLLGGGAAILIALIFAWLFMSLLFARHLERRLTLELTRDATRIAAAAELDPSGNLSVAGGIGDPRFDTPAGGFYWQVSTPEKTVRSRSLWDMALARPGIAAVDGWRLRQSDGPFGEPIMVLEREVRLTDDTPPVMIQVAQNQAETASAQDHFNLELAVFLGGLWLVLLAAAWLQVQLGLRPLADIQRDLAELRANPSHRLPTPRLNDLVPLTEALNDLVSAREKDLTQARGRASDLAHGLKTPLSALKTQSHRMREAGAVEAAERLDRAVDSMRATVEAELTRSRLAGQSPGGASSVHDVAERVVQVLEQTERGEALVFSVDVCPTFVAPIGRDDLTDLIGPLLENAVRFARRRVLISAQQTADAHLVISVEDDGPGIPIGQVDSASHRGVRLDEQGAGQGLGLSIARTCADNAGGYLHLTRSVLGGLKAEVSWSRQIKQAGAVGWSTRPNVE